LDILVNNADIKSNSVSGAGKATDEEFDKTFKNNHLLATLLLSLHAGLPSRELRLRPSSSPVPKETVLQGSDKLLASSATKARSTLHENALDGTGRKESRTRKRRSLPPRPPSGLSLNTTTADKPSRTARSRDFRQGHSFKLPAHPRNRTTAYVFLRSRSRFKFLHRVVPAAHGEHIFQRRCYVGSNSVPSGGH